MCKGDVQHPPFAPETFDVVYSDGVPHHTPKTEVSFCALAPLVKRGGRYFVWLYRSDLSPIYSVKLKTAKTLQSILRPVPLPVLRHLCFAGAALLVLRLRSPSATRQSEATNRSFKAQGSKSF